MALRLRSANASSSLGRMEIVRSPVTTSPEDTGFVTKSGAETLDLIEIRDHLTVLKSAAGVRLRALNEKQRRSYNAIVSLIQRHHGNSSLMSQLQTLFQEFFEGTVPEPGTVASYFVGCSTQPVSSFVPRNCDLYCAASLTNLGRSEEAPCGARVILAIWDGTKFTFVIISSALSEDAIIYFTEPSFPGLIQAEIDELARMGVTQAMLVHYDSKTHSYKQLQGWTGLDKLPQRVDVIPCEVGINRNPNAVFFILLFVLFLIVIYIGWRIYTSRFD